MSLRDKIRLYPLTRNKLIVAIIRIIVCSFLVYFIVTKFSIEKIIHAIKMVDIQLFMAVLVFHVLANMFIFLRWFLIMRYTDMKVSAGMAAKSYMMAVFLNFFLPTSVGGDVFKAYYVSKNIPNCSIEKSFFSVFFDRYLGLLVMLAVGGFFSLFLKGRVNGVHLSGIIFAMFAVLLLLSVFVMMFADKLDGFVNKVVFLRRKFADTFRKISVVLKGEKKDKSVFLGMIICSLSSLLMLCLMHYIFVFKMATVSAFIPVLVFVPVTIVCTMIPISLNGIGVREIIYVALFKTINVDPAVSIAMSVLFYGVMVVFSLPGGFFLLKIITGKNEKLNLDSDKK